MSDVSPRAALGVAAIVAAALLLALNLGSPIPPGADSVGRALVEGVSEDEGATPAPLGGVAQALGAQGDLAAHDGAAARIAIEPPKEKDESFVLRYSLENLPLRWPGDRRDAFGTLFLGYQGDRGATIELGRVEHKSGEGSIQIAPVQALPRSIPDMIQSAHFSLATRPTAIGNPRAIYVGDERPWTGGVALRAGTVTLPSDGDPGFVDLGEIRMTPYPKVGTIRLIDPGEHTEVTLRVSTRRMASRAAGIMEIGTAFEGRTVWMKRHQEEVEIFAEEGVATWTVSVMSPEGKVLSTQESPAGEDIPIDLD